MLVAVIVTCEVLFWVLVLAGLAVRYLLRRPRLGGRLLVAAPLVDLVLLVATVLDLRGGATATTAHALAAVYLGVSVGFGHSMVRWADVRFAHRFAGGPEPEPRPRSGRAHAAHERRGFGRHLLAYAVGAGLLGVAILVIGDPDRTGALLGMLRLWSVVVAVDGLVSLSYTVRPRPTGVGARR
ncbi:hypothetical protein [Phycicoccus sonneratiae]|uniref:Integral membrane protein n=1 Tax=Phycicoccus sonneratiae TaxID=2807628 RepID=A0ABS2CJH5_9MICO|nr:hypothetical protein [Phycicoccus sonneraticus]MBM6400042.1 hypothetical protein [Phycicoccus sonneraticus]